MRCEICLQPATLLKLTLLHGCFPRFLNCTNGTKSHNTPQISLGLGILLWPIYTAVSSSDQLIPDYSTVTRIDIQNFYKNNQTADLN